jgi:hypothetical protein
MAHKKLYAEPLFEKFDLVAHRRLSHPQFLGGTRKTQFTRNGLKNADCSK